MCAKGAGFADAASMAAISGQSFKKRAGETTEWEDILVRKNIIEEKEETVRVREDPLEEEAQYKEVLVATHTEDAQASFAAATYAVDEEERAILRLRQKRLERIRH